MTMSRKAKRGDRCSDCRMKNSFCICEWLNPFFTKTFVTVLMHQRETYTTTNTARVANSLLTESEILYRGRIDDQLSAEKVFKPGYKQIYLYPSEKSQPLTNFLKTDEKIQLIVPDGSWRQTKKFAKRESYLNEIPHFHLELEKPSLFFLRRKVKAEGMSTMEAIARALGIIESAEVQEKLEQVFLVLVDKTLQSRGQKLEHKMLG
jgi:DTW domain-containing protein YfiP